MRRSLPSLARLRRPVDDGIGRRRDLHFCPDRSEYPGLLLHRDRPCSAIGVRTTEPSPLMMLQAKLGSTQRPFIGIRLPCTYSHVTTELGGASWRIPKLRGQTSERSSPI